MGIEEVTEIEQFRRVYRQLQNYAKRQFGDGGVLIEQCLRDYNHLEVQLVCSKYGERIHFSSRNCTIQSTGRQKRVEAAPGFHDSCFEYDFDEKKLLDQIVKYSLKLAEYVKYDNVGTWEWIISRSDMELPLQLPSPGRTVGRTVGFRWLGPYPSPAAASQQPPDLLHGAAAEADLQAQKTHLPRA